MKNSWSEVVANAKPFIEYLNRDTFFQNKYSGSPTQSLIITNPTITIEYLSDDSNDIFDDWESEALAKLAGKENVAWRGKRKGGGGWPFLA